MYFIGIDLAWTYRNETGITIFKDRKCVFSGAKVYSDEMLVEIMKGYSPCIVSIDAPLVVNNESGGRSVDSQVMKTSIHKRYLKLYATSRTYMLRAFGAIRGEKILKLSELELSKTIYETYPTGIFLSLFPELYDNKYKISSRKTLEELIENSQKLLEAIQDLGFHIDIQTTAHTKKAYKTFEDQVDSVLCALNSYYAYYSKNVLFQDESGAIALPDYEKVMSYVND